MNIYEQLNKVIEYIEENLENEIDYKKIGAIIGSNEQFTKTIFVFLTGISLNAYIRNRQMSKAIHDLEKNMKIIDIATKYGYASPTTFSRAFEKFHGIKPSALLKKGNIIKNYPIITFEEKKSDNHLIEYKIKELDNLTLYGRRHIMKIDEIYEKSSKLWQDISIPKAGKQFGILVYPDKWESNEVEYWIALEKKHSSSEKLTIPSSKYIVFTIKENDPALVPKISKNAYVKYVPSTNYKITEAAEIEIYYEDHIEVWLPIK